MFLQVQTDRLLDPDLVLEDLDFEYCLPKGFWTNTEWYKYNKEKLKLLQQIKEHLRQEELYFSLLYMSEGN